MQGKSKLSILGDWLALLASVLVVAGVAHLAWSGLMVSIIHKYYDHRLLNVRKLQNMSKEGIDFSNSFFRNFVDSKSGKKEVLFVGSSFTYGYPWQEGVIFSRLVADHMKDHKIGNFSVIGASMQGIVDYPFCLDGSAGLPDVLIVEIPLVNSISGIGARKTALPSNCRADESPRDYGRTVLSRPWGMGWVKLLWDEEAYAKPDAKLSAAPLPGNYFASAAVFKEIESVYISDLKKYLDSVSRLGKTVWVYVSPVYTPVIDEVGGDRAAVEYQINLSYEICKQNGKVICLDASSFGSRPELFYNLTHLNQRGHQALAAWFEQNITQYGRHPQSPSFPTLPN